MGLKLPLGPALGSLK